MKYCVFLIFLFSSIATAFAAPIYKWKDNNGVTHYSSKPSSPQAKPADLPKIMKAQFKLKEAEIQSCKAHGGVNCKAGADKDGSVICYDGFSEASTRFIFSCSSPKLEIADISEPDRDGNFTVFIRNTTSVDARGTEVFYASKLLERKTRLDGPSAIEPFGVAEFYFQPDNLKKGQVPKLIASAEIKLTCENCS